MPPPENPAFLPPGSKRAPMNLIQIFMAFVITLALFFFVLIALAFVFNARQQRAIAKARQDGFYPMPGAGTDADVERLARAGQKIWAIKVYREIHGCGLKDAKEAVEKIPL
jgi:hypothetical protein